MSYRFYSKSFSLFVGGAISLNLCSCSNSKSSSVSKACIPSTTILTTSNEIDSSVICTTENDFYSESDSIVLNQFSELNNDIRNSFNSSDLLDKGKVYFIYCVDFLFFDGEIKGVKFSDLSDIARCQLINDIITIDGLICSKFPNYKSCIADSVSAAYNKASMIIHSGSIKVDDYSRERLGDDNYAKIKEYKDLFVVQTSRDWDEFVFIIGEGYNKGKIKVKDWYEGYKKKNGQ